MVRISERVSLDVGLGKRLLAVQPTYTARREGLGVRTRLLPIYLGPKGVKL
jgi:hypothetical protein